MTTLRARLALGILALVVLTTLLMWGISARGVFRPFARQVFEAFVDQAVYVAEQVEGGADPHRLGDQLGMDIGFLHEGPGPPPGGRGGRVGRGPGPGRGGSRPFDDPDFDPTKRPGFSTLERGGRTIAFPPGPRDRLLVETSRGWLFLVRDLDLDVPQRRLGLWLTLAGGVVLLVSGALASAVTRPLTTAREGMERIASGDLEHRLEERGPDEIVRVAAAFNHMADRIEGLVRTERELMAGMSHELRTPLSRLRLEVELLREQGGDPRRLDAMEGDLGELEALIGQLLQLSRLQLGEQALRKAEVSWPVLVDRALETVDLSKHDVVRRGPGGAFQGDPDLLLRVAVNLLQNAARYAPAGSTVTVSTEGARLTVEDEGPGVPVDQLPRLFDPFWRGEGSRARATGGLGLGLMLVRQVVELHGGSVRAANRTGGGLRIDVDLGEDGATMAA